MVPVNVLCVCVCVCMCPEVCVCVCSRWSVVRGLMQDRCGGGVYVRCGWGVQGLYVGELCV